MSIQISTQTWKTSSHSGTELLMLLAVSDFANQSGEAWPSVATLAQMCRVTPRHANRMLVALQKTGELEVKLRHGPRGCNLYIVHPGQRVTPAKDPKLPQAPRANPCGEAQAPPGDSVVDTRLEDLLLGNKRSDCEG